MAGQYKICACILGADASYGAIHSKRERRQDCQQYFPDFIRKKYDMTDQFLEGS
jgi:hypothetical protein